MSGSTSTGPDVVYGNPESDGGDEYSFTSFPHMIRQDDGSLVPAIQYRRVMGVGPATHFCRRWLEERWGGEIRDMAIDELLFECVWELRGCESRLVPADLFYAMGVLRAAQEEG